MVGFEIKEMNTLATYWQTYSSGQILRDKPAAAITDYYLNKQQGIFYMQHLVDKIVHTGVCGIPNKNGNWFINSMKTDTR